MCSILTLTIGNNQGVGDVEYGKIYDMYSPPAYLRLFDGPSCSVVDMWRILGRCTSNGGLGVGTIIKPKLGLQPKPFDEACLTPLAACLHASQRPAGRNHPKVSTGVVSRQVL